MPRASLDRLPAGILEIIASSLSLCDLSSLRLTSVEVAANASRVHFRSLFHSKTITLTSKRQLDEAVYMTSAGQLGSLVQKLTLKGVLPAADGDTHPGNLSGVVQDLEIVLTNIRNNADAGRLACLRLDAAHEEAPVLLTEENYEEQLSKATGRWRLHWLAAEWTFVTVCTALATSALPIDQLDIFNSVHNCSLACDALQPVLDASDLSTPLAGLKTLSLSLSNHLHYPGKDAVSYGQQVCRLLELCPNLESLELHWYSIMPSRQGTRPADYLFFDVVADSIRLPRLHSLSLRGLFISETPLLTFLSHTAGLTSLTLEETRLLSGSFSSVLAATVPALTHLHLDSLYNPGGILQFYGPGEPHFITSHLSRMGPFHLFRNGPDAGLPIDFDVIQGPALASTALSKRFKWRALHFGPPPIHTQWAENPSERQLELQQAQQKKYRHRLLAEQRARQQENETHWLRYTPLNATLGAGAQPEIPMSHPMSYTGPAFLEYPEMGGSQNLQEQFIEQQREGQQRQQHLQQYHETRALRQQQRLERIQLLGPEEREKQLRLERVRQEQYQRQIDAGWVDMGGYWVPKGPE